MGMKCLCVVCGVSALPWMDCRSVYLSWSPLPMLQILSLQQPSALSASLPGGVSAWWNRPATQQPLAHRTWEAFSPRVDVDMTQAGALHRFEKVWRRGWGGGSERCRRQPLAHRTWEAFSPLVDIDMMPAERRGRRDRASQGGRGMLAASASSSQGGIVRAVLEAGGRRGHGLGRSGNMYLGPVTRHPHISQTSSTQPTHWSPFPTLFLNPSAHVLPTYHLGLIAPPAPTGS